MGKASSAKKVARAARTGGGRTARGRSAGLWPALLTFVVMLGVVLIVISRNANTSTAATAPRVLGSGGSNDHWHAAYGIFICDKFIDPLPDDSSTGSGIHTHADGLIHVEAVRATEAGKNATLGKFVSEYPGMKLSPTSITVPTTKKTYRDGVDKCGDKVGHLKVTVNGKPVKGDPRDIRLEDQQKIVIAFAPDGTEVPADPPSAQNLANPNAGEGGQQTQPSVTIVPATPGSTDATTPGSTPPASAPPASTAPASTPATTAAP
jgi:hypothetical protein